MKKKQLLFKKSSELNLLDLTYFWVSGVIIYFLLFPFKLDSIIEVFIPITLVFFLIIFYSFFLSKLFKNPKGFAYLLFFSISIFSFFGLTETLTGKASYFTSSYLYGFSFYTLSLAYWIYSHKGLKIIDILKFSNPILLSTGPIIILLKSLKHKSFISRLNYFLPFLMVGIFFFQILSVPLTSTFFLIEKTDVVSSVVFGVIFELFVYTNFCGLSLILYGILGILGYRIPLNFQQPFSSNNLIEFWRGWHITLSRVLKILFYDETRKYLPASGSLFFVFFASSMWHGVSFNFFIWGVFHTVTFIFTIFLLKHKQALVSSILMFFGIIFGRIIFADNDINRLLEKFKFNFKDFEVFETLSNQPSAVLLSIFLSISLVAFEFCFKRKKFMIKKNYKFLRSPFALLCIALIFILFVSDFGDSFAIYGQR